MSNKDNKNSAQDQQIQHQAKEKDASVASGTELSGADAKHGKTTTEQDAGLSS